MTSPSILARDSARLFGLPVRRPAVVLQRGPLQRRIRAVVASAPVKRVVPLQRRGRQHAGLHRGGSESSRSA